jgi:hypothetical protein
MPATWVLLTVAASALAAGGWSLLVRRLKPVAYADPREERLTLALARVVGCPPREALEAVRREIDLAPGQSDETLIKRAAYHYRQDLPEKSCRSTGTRPRGDGDPPAPVRGADRLVTHPSEGGGSPASDFGHPASTPDQSCAQSAAGRISTRLGTSARGTRVGQ